MWCVSVRVQLHVERECNGGARRDTQKAVVAIGYLTRPPLPSQLHIPKPVFGPGPIAGELAKMQPPKKLHFCLAKRRLATTERQQTILEKRLGDGRPNQGQACIDFSQSLLHPNILCACVSVHYLRGPGQSVPACICTLLSNRLCWKKNRIAWPRFRSFFQQSLRSAFFLLQAHHVNNFNK